MPKFLAESDYLVSNRALTLSLTWTMASGFRHRFLEPQLKLDKMKSSDQGLTHSGIFSFHFSSPVQVSFE